ncbi:MAG: hypothetical protein QW512_00520 [Thermofilaceae archaeon]
MDVSPSHCCGRNVAHFFLVMFAYNLMNWFRKLVLGQREAERMAKWTRQQILLTAGKLAKRGRRWVCGTGCERRGTSRAKKGWHPWGSADALARRGEGEGR